MEIVSFKKNNKVGISSPKQENYHEVNLVNSSNQSQLEDELEKKRKFYGKSFLLSFPVAIINIFLSTNPAFGLIFCAIACMSMNKANDANRDLGEIYHNECAMRLGESLSAWFEEPGTTIFSAHQDERLHIDRIIFVDYLLSLPSGSTFAISLRTILPNRKEPDSPKVSFDKNKNQLAYRKSKTAGKRYFKPEPIAALKGSIDIIASRYTNLGKRPYIPILVIADPIILNIYRNSPIKILEQETYMCFDDVYIVEESRLPELVHRLNALMTNRVGENT